MKRNTPKKVNQLKELIYLNNLKECSKQAQKSLFRSVIEPILNASNQGIVLIRCFDTENLTGVIQRLQFSNIKVYSFSDNLKDNSFDNLQKENIWEQTEFIIVLAHRYSAMLVWDYTTSEKNDFCNLSIMMNSRKITDYCKIIAQNSLIDFSGHIDEFQPDRRENETMNEALGKIVDFATEANEEVLVKEFENEALESNIALFQRYEISAKTIRIISHEIKNNLSVIDLYSKVIEKRTENPDKNSKSSILNAINCINRAHSNISALLMEIKSFQSTKIEEIDLDDILKNTVELAEMKAQDRGIELIIENHFNVSILADKIKLANVILNLIYNSIEATPIDRQNPKIIISTDIQDKNVHIRIIDNGCGIRADYQDKIFDLEFTTKENGSGIGLYISKESMKEQNGDLNLVSSDLENTIFELTIPISAQ